MDAAPRGEHRAVRMIDRRATDITAAMRVPTLPATVARSAEGRSHEERIKAMTEILGGTISPRSRRGSQRALKRSPCKQQPFETAGI